jgi:hypothetical protein
MCQKILTALKNFEHLKIQNYKKGIKIKEHPVANILPLLSFAHVHLFISVCV